MNIKLGNKLLIVFLALSMLMLIPTSFATTVSEVAINDVQTDLSVENENIVGVDNHNDDQAYIQFSEDYVSMKENQSTIIEGGLYYESPSGQMEYFDTINVVGNYNDADGVERTTDTFKVGDFNDYSIKLNTSSLVGITPRDNPYKITFTPVEDDDYDNLLNYLPDGLAHSSVYLTVVSKDTPIVNPDIVIPDVSNGVKIYVDTKGSDISGNGSKDNPYATIINALNIAKTSSGCEIIVNAGNYVLDNYNIETNVTIRGVGNVVITPQNQRQLFVRADNTKLIGLTFLKATNGALSTSSTSGGDGNTNRYLLLENCTFKNNKGDTAAITSYINTVITGCNFIENTATGSSGAWSGIVSLRESRMDMYYNNFINNTIKESAPLIYVGTNKVNLDYNFWGDNNKAKLNDDAKAIINNWVVINSSINNSDVVIGDIAQINIDFKLTTNGTTFKNLNKSMPGATFKLNSILGNLNPATITISNNTASTEYSAIAMGDEVINVGNITSLNFHVNIDMVNRIYVATNGSDSNLGTIDSPLKTIGVALTKNVAMGGNKTIIISNGIYQEHDLIINKDVTIVGESKDNTIIDGKNNGRLLYILANTKIYNLTFTNGFLDKDDGGAIYIDKGDVLINNCIFKDCQANSGGAILSNSPLTINNTIFENNTNVGSTIYATSKVTINNSTFTNNSGRTISIASDALIANSTFTNNLAKQNGAIYVNADNMATITITNNKFTSNKGGAIYTALAKSIVILNNLFNLNTGDGIFTYGNITENNIINNEFIDNSGYAIVISNYSSANLANNIMSDSGKSILFNGLSIATPVLAFLNNESVKVKNGSIKLNVTVSDDMGNPITGGVIKFIANNKTIGQSEVKNGKASFDYEVNTGEYVISGIYAGNNQSTVKTGLLRVNVENHWFINETGYETIEEAIAAAGFNDIIKGIPRTYVVNDEIAIGHRYRPSEVYSINKTITITSINDKPVTFMGNDSRIFNIDKGSYLTLKNIILTNGSTLNNAVSYAGAVHIQFGANLTVINCTFENNTAGYSGAIESWGGLTIINSTFRNNVATKTYAGAIYKDGDGELVIINSTFENNSAITYAGAIYAMGYSNNNNIIINTKFINNNGNRGGAIFTSLSSLSVTNSSFIGNKAIDKNTGYSASGGAIYDHSSRLTITNTKFIDNAADENGGALELGNTITTYLNSSSTTIIDWTVIINSTFTNNYARKEGGAIFNGENVAYTNISGSKFTNNFALITGGAIANYFSFIWADSCEFINNEARDASIIYMYGHYNYPYDYYANLTLTNSKFANNTGESLFELSTSHCYLNMINSTFNERGLIIQNNGSAYLINNSVKNTHEGIVINNAASLSLEDNSFNCNGSAIFNNGLILTKVFFIVLNNQTVNVGLDEITSLTGVLYDDNRNIIIPGKVTFSVEGRNFTATLNNKTGVFSTKYSSNVFGNHSVSAIYQSNTKISVTYLNGAINVGKAIPNVNVTFNNESIYGEDIKVNLEINKDATGNVVFTIGNITKTVTIVNGIASATFDGVVPGNHTLNVYYSGDNKYNNLTKNYNLNVAKSALVNFTLLDLEKYFGESKKLEAILTNSLGNPIANGTIIFTVNDKDYVRFTDINGRASMAINLNPGNYFVSAKFNGTADYNQAVTNAAVVVKSTTIGQDIVKMFRNSTQYYALFLDNNGNPLVNVSVKFNINGVMYERQTNASGIAKLNINLNPGNYVITNYNTVTGEENSNNITVKSLIADNFDLVKYYKNESKYAFKVYGMDGKVAANQEVTFNINGVFYKRVSDENGVVSLAINLRPGEYILTADFEGCKVSNKIAVKPTLITNDLSMTYTDESKFNAAVLDGEGKPLANQNIIFNVNGVFYNKISDENGITSLNINLMKGKYIITSMWNGYQVGNNITIS